MEWFRITPLVVMPPSVVGPSTTTPSVRLQSAEEPLMCSARDTVDSQCGSNMSLTKNECIQNSTPSTDTVTRNRGNVAPALSLDDHQLNSQNTKNNVMPTAARKWDVVVRSVTKAVTAPVISSAGRRFRRGVLLLQRGLGILSVVMVRSSTWQSVVWVNTANRARVAGASKSVSAS